MDEALEALHAFQRSLMAATWAGWSELDLTLRQLKALHFLGEGRGLTVGGLAELLGTKLPAASIQADHLVRAGLVERTDDPEDRRRVRLALTPHGEELASRPREMPQRLRALLAAMPEADLRALVRGLRALAAVSAAGSANGRPSRRSRDRGGRAADPEPVP